MLFGANFHEIRSPTGGELLALFCGHLPLHVQIGFVGNQRYRNPACGSEAFG